jgi:mono/diheme cytochrome c family protein
MDDFRRIFFGVLIGFVLVIVGWISFVTFRGCGSSLNCALAGPTAEHTSIPSLVPGTLPPVNAQLGAAGATSGPAGTQAAASGVPRPSNPGGPGKAVDLTGNVDSGKAIFAANCAVCHAAEGKGGIPNPGSDDGTIPPLNPIDPLLKDPDNTVYRTNVDLFIEHGSTPAGPGPTFSMPAWGDKQLLTPQQIADVLAYVISLNGGPSTAQGSGTSSAPTSAPTTAAGQPTGTAVAASSGASPTPAASEPEPTEEVARPSNPGGPGAAVNLTGDPASGQQIFVANCQICHNTEGKGGNPNPGSGDGTIPPLNPIDPTLINPDPKVFATNLDLFREHGSTPEGPGPTFSMPAWGDKQLLTPQQIADVIAYVMSLNK